MYTIIKISARQGAKGEKIRQIVNFSQIAKGVSLRIEYILICFNFLGIWVLERDETLATI